MGACDWFWRHREYIPFVSQPLSVGAAPFEYGVSRAAWFGENSIGMVQQIFTNWKDLEELKRENESLKAEQNRYSEVLAENIRLRNLLKFKQGYTSYNMVGASVIERDYGGWTHTMVIDRSTFLSNVLLRLSLSLGYSYDETMAMIAGSFMISADNAHSVHPNHEEYADPVNRPVINKGIVIKYNAQQRYATDALSAARFKNLCEEIHIPTQTFTNRSDNPGGSTLGNISNTKVAMPTVDIGLSQLAMHSSYETAGTLDTAYLAAASAKFFD